MPTELELLQGEEIIATVYFEVKKKEMAPWLSISNQAIHILKQKTFAVSDAFYVERIPAERVTRVVRKKISPVVLWFFSIVFIVFGGYFSYIICDGYFSDMEGQGFTGWPIAIFVAGLVMPFISFKRYKLIVYYDTGKLVWKPELNIDPESRKRVRDLQDSVLSACESIGIEIEDNSVSTRYVDNKV